MEHSIIVEAAFIGPDDTEIAVECSCGAILAEGEWQMSLDEIVDAAWRHRD